jgi:uncharacterized protein YjbI with pentapeptide repeats
MTPLIYLFPVWDSPLLKLLNIFHYKTFTNHKHIHTYISILILNSFRVRLGLRFQKVRFQNCDFKMCDFKRVIFKNAVKHLAKSQFDL